MAQGSKAWLLATVSAAVLTTPAYAQQQSAQSASRQASESGTAGLDEILVTAQKREERILDVPQSVSVISADDLQAFHAERLADYFTRIPSANVVEGQSGQARLVLRGINTGGVSATVATYVDESPYGSTTGLANGGVLAPDIDPFDLQRIEVLRGPQGTLYGANSLGGLVKYVTVAPQTDAFHAAAEAGVESVSNGSTGWSTRAAVNVPFSDGVAMRVSGFYRKNPGYIDDVLKGEDVNDGKTRGGRVSLLVRPSDNLTLRGSVFYEDLDSDGSNNYDGDLFTLRPTIGELKTRRVASEPNNLKYRIYNLTGEYDFGAVKLLSATTLGTLGQEQVQDASGVYGPLLTEIFEAPLGVALPAQLDQRRVTQEIRLASSGEQKFEWTVGGYYSKERNELDQSLDGVNDPDGSPAPGLEGLALVNLKSKYEEYAAFANGTIHFTPKFDLSVGGRFSDNKQSADQTTGGPLQGDSDVPGNSSENVFTYSVAPAYKPNESTTFYARVARGYRPGGPNVVPPLSPDEVPREFEADTTTNYELGAKAELFDRRLAVELTAYYIDWSNIQLLVGVAGLGVNTNAGSARSQGFEFSATARPVEGLTLGFNGAYVDAELTSEGSPLSGGVDGDQLPYNPRFASTLSADYDRPLSGEINGTFGVSWRYVGERRADFNAAFDQQELDAYSQVDAHAGITFGKFRLDAFVRNLTDSRGITNVGVPGSALDGAISVAVTRPRSYGLTIGYTY